MKEDFLHYLWKFQKWNSAEPETTEHLPLKVISPGEHNFLSGPDFFNSRLIIGDQEWAGNVEIHINASDWYFHGHETDPNYDNVILHVVWNHDTDVFRKDNSPIPVFELRSFISEKAIKNYETLFQTHSKNWINCAPDFHSVEDFKIKNWLERLYFERLEEKSAGIFQLLARSKNNWEEVLFKLLSRNFGLNINGDAFFSIANSFPYSVLQKERHQAENLEALFFGQAGFLEQEVEEVYFLDLKNRYNFLCSKYKIDNSGVIRPKYFRLRPDNFPDIRLSQLAMLYHRQDHVFSEIINCSSVKEFRELFEVEASKFWSTHFNFKRSHKFRRKKLSRNFKDLLLINTLVPVKFCYSKQNEKPVEEELLEIMGSLETEKNSVVKAFNELKPSTATTALHSQALLQLKSNYCEKNKCLKCALGNDLLQRGIKN